MDNLYLITPAMKKYAIKKALLRILYQRHKAVAMRKIAAFLGDNQVVTEKIEPQLQELFPDAEVQVHGYDGKKIVDVLILDGSDQILISNRFGQQMDAKNLIECATEEDKKADMLEKILANVDTLINDYNAIADVYARLYSDLQQLVKFVEPFPDLPDPDIDLEYRYSGQHCTTNQLMSE